MQCSDMHHNLVDVLCKWLFCGRRGTCEHPGILLLIGYYRVFDLKQAREGSYGAQVQMVSKSN